MHIETKSSFLRSSFTTDLLSVTMEPCKMRTCFQHAQASVNTVLHKAKTPCIQLPTMHHFQKYTLEKTQEYT